MSFLPPWSDVRQKVGEFPVKAKQSFREFNLAESWRNFHTSNRMIVLVVFIAIYIDNMLTTTVVPVIPNFLFQKEHPEDYQRVRGNLNTPGSVERCEEIQKDATNILDFLTNNGTALNETISDPQVRDLFYNVTHERNCTLLTIAPEVMRKLSEERLQEQSTRVGLLFASKSAVQLIANPFIGPLTNRLGYSIPMFTGFIIIFISTMVFAFGKSYWVLLTARAVQGAGSSCTTVSGMGLIADKYPDDGERGNAMAIALSGLALGVLIGPTFGGLLYDFIGKEAPFLFLAALALVDGGLQLYAMKPSRTPEPQKGASMAQLLQDPYILLAAGAITFSNMGIGMLEPTLPAFMLQTMNAQKWEQGIAFLPASLSYMFGTIIFGHVSLKMGRWRAAMIGMFVISLALFVIPFSKTLPHLIAPNLCLGLAIGMVDSAMMPTMGYLVDLRHISVYGSVYAIADVAFCLGFAVGPAVGGVIVETIGFEWMLWIISLTNLMYAPLLYFLRNPPGNGEKMQLVLNDKCPIKYVTYKQSSADDEETENGNAEIESLSYTEQTELTIEEYSGNGEQTTHHTNFVRRPVASSVVDNTDSDSGDTDGADDSECESSSDSEHHPQ